MNIGEKIKIRRQELGWSQQKLADLMDYTSKSTITKIEKGLSDVGQKNIIKFSKVLGVSIAYLMDWDEDEKPTINADDELLELYEIFKKATPEQRKRILRIADTLLQDE